MANKYRKDGKKWNDGKHPHNWKGNKVGFGALHYWLGTYLGKPSYCAYCQITDINIAKRIDN